MLRASPPCSPGLYEAAPVRSPIHVEHRVHGAIMLRRGRRLPRRWLDPN
jgi:hypothetical protein